MSYYCLSATPSPVLVAPESVGATSEPTKGLPIRHFPFYLSDFAIREQKLVIGRMIGDIMNKRSLVASSVREDPTIFADRFWRSYRLLRLIACRILAGPEWAEKAIDNCWQTSSRYLPKFEYEGAFRSWLLRVLIDEALHLRKNYEMDNLGLAELSAGSACALPIKRMRNGDQDQIPQHFSVAME